MQTSYKEMKMKSKKEVNTTQALANTLILQNAKVKKDLDESIFICKQNDKDCWHRYSSAMGDCV